MIVNISLVMAAYLLGSIPSAVWIGRRFYRIDIRQHGSRNAGTTNTLRVLGAKAALPVFVIDFLKGFAAVSLACLSPFEGDAVTDLEIILVVTVVLGHIYPLFAGFKGGKGVATMAGSLLALHPPAVLVCLGVFLAVFLISHYVSLGSISAGIAFPVMLFFLFHETYPPLIAFGCLVAALLVFTHRKNIKRLLGGTESKIRFGKRG